MLLAGVDDAGRGSVIGPLVIAGVLLDERDLSELEALKVKDSKLLSPLKREWFAEKIEKTALKYHVVEFSPAEIDRVVIQGRKYHRLNRLEACGMAEVILNLKPDVAFVDASDVVAGRFGEHILERLPFKVDVVSEHKADRNYPIVSGASILAKVRRDAEVAKLRNEYGDLGSGYASDYRTKDFLKTWMREHGSYPECVRKSWETAKRIKAKYCQTKIL
ncbi:MAG: ribonuclease HII [Candidatus Bathyarchaeota archaeon]|nr:ribonuclease HII [Candidatus Bathyarchaeota archaeon]